MLDYTLNEQPVSVTEEPDGVYLLGPGGPRKLYTSDPQGGMWPIRTLEFLDGCIRMDQPVMTWPARAHPQLVRGLSHA